MTQVRDDLLPKLKLRLGIVDELQDDLLIDILDLAIDQFNSITKNDGEVPKRYHYIILEVALLKYNRKGSEGMKSESVDGYSVTYDTDDFKSYMWILNRDFGLDERTHREKGQVKFF